MSVIFGIRYFDGRPISPLALRRMTAKLAHRGPDGSNLWWDGSIGLGHRMLHTTPESHYEHLPIADEKNRFLITADVRLDNRDELIRELNLGGLGSSEKTDSELILAAYCVWGQR